MALRGKNRNAATEAAAARPALPWLGGRPLVPSIQWSRDAEWRLLLATLDEPGCIGPYAGAAWALRLTGARAMAASDFHLTAHGFQARWAEDEWLEAWVVQPGVLVMDISANVEAMLESSSVPVQRVGEYSGIEGDETSVCLFSRRAPAGPLRVVLAHRTDSLKSLYALIQSCHQESLRRFAEEESGVVAGFWAGQGELTPASGLALARALDTLEGALRSPSGHLPYRWSLASDEPAGGQSTNDLYALVRAWSLVEPAVAADLVMATLSAQREDGSVPRVVRPDGFHDTQWEPLPLLARSAWTAWQNHPDREFYDYIVPRLHRYLNWAITYFDHDWRGLPLWSQANEAWIPETYDSLIAPPDLPALLASEIDALRDLARAVPAGEAPTPDLLAYRECLTRIQAAFLWNKDEALFQERFTNSEYVRRLTLSSALPLLDTTLTRDALRPIAERLSSVGGLRTPEGLRDWVPWADEPCPPPHRDAHQMLVLAALEESGEDTIARSLRQQLADLHASQPDEVRTPVSAALRVVTLGRQVREAQPYALISPHLTWLDHHRKGVLWATALLVVAALTFAMTFLVFKRSWTVQESDAGSGMARRLYEERNYLGSRALLNEIIGSGRTFQGIYFLLGITEYRLTNWVAAEAAFRNEMKRNPEAGSAQMNLALIMLQQERKAEALELYKDITNRFAGINPMVVDRATMAIHLLDESSSETTSRRGAARGKK